MISPINHSDQELRSLMNEFQTKKTPIESNNMIGKINTFIRENQDVLSPEALQDLRFVLASRMKQLKPMQKNMQIQNVIRKLTFLDRSINHIMMTSKTPYNNSAQKENFDMEDPSYSRMRMKVEKGIDKKEINDIKQKKLKP